MASIAYSLFLRDSVLLLMACLHGGGGGGGLGGGAGRGGDLLGWGNPSVHIISHFILVKFT